MEMLNKKLMIKKFTSLRKYAGTVLFSLATIFVSQAQIIQNGPTNQTPSYGTCSICNVVTSINNIDHSMTVDTTTYTEIFTRREGGLTGQKWAQVAYDIQPAADNQKILVRLTASNNPAEPAVTLGNASNTEGGTTLNLSYGGVQVPTSNIKLMEFRDVHNNTWYRLTTAAPYDQLVIRVTSKNYDINYDNHIRSAKIYSIHTSQGSATLDDCGTPAMIAFEGAIDGVPLAGPVTARLWEAIDGDFESHTSGVLAGLLNIGAPSWNYQAVFNGLSGETSTLKLTLGRGATIVNLSGVRYRVHFMRNGNTFNSTDWSTLQVLGLLAINSYAPLTFYHESPGAFDEVRLEVQVPGVSVTGEMIRVYDIRRTVSKPTLSGASSATMEVPQGSMAEILATGAATEYLWYQGIQFTDPDTKLSGYIIDTALGLIGKTTGQETATPLRTITQFAYGEVTQDSVIFVRSIRAACPLDTSAAHAINLRVITPPLPVTLAEFSVIRNGSESLLHWSTTEESNNQYFEIQKSNDAKTWEGIGQIASQAINGTHKGLLNYQYPDPNPYEGVTYYRLIQVDLDGKLSASRIIHIILEGLPDNTSYVYPNPAENYFQVAASAGSEVILYDMLGRVMDRKTANSTLQGATFETSHLTAGNYIVHIIKDGITQKHLLRIQK
jgi:hypothetical protein